MNYLDSRTPKEKEEDNEIQSATTSLEQIKQLKEKALRERRLEYYDRILNSLLGDPLFWEVVVKKVRAGNIEVKEFTTPYETGLNKEKPVGKKVKIRLAKGNIVEREIID